MDLIFSTNPNQKITKLLDFWIPSGLTLLTLLPAILILVYLKRFLGNLEYVDKRIQ